MNTECLFTCMVSTLTHRFKPKGKEAAKLKLPKFNEKRTLTIQELGELIDQGHSFHASVLDFSRHQNPHETAGYDRTCFVPNETTLLSIDVDHGHYPLQRLKEVMRVPHALIYQTHSFTKDKRKWRVLFIANRPIKDEVEFDLVQHGLIFQFAKPFDPKTLEDKVDFSAKDPARLSFGGKKVIETHSRTFDVDRFIETLKEENIYEQIDQFKLEWKLAHEEPKEEKSSTYQAGRLKEKCLTKEAIDLVSLVDKMSFYFPQELPRILPIERFLYHLNQVPLHEVLGVREGETFRCLLPHHEDKKPSAVILKNKKGQSRYYCHGCGEGKSLSILEFMMASQDLDTTDSLINDTAPIAALFGYQLTEDPLKVVAYNQTLLKQPTEVLTQLEQEVIRRLTYRKLLDTYQAMLELAEKKLALKVYNEAGGYCFYMANRYVQTYCHQKGIKGHTTQASTGAKLNRLVHYHLLDKVPFDGLTPEMKAHVLEEFYNSKEDKQKKMITIYQVPRLDETQLQRILNQFKYDQDHKVKSAGFGSKQLTQALGEDHAREVFPDTDGVTLSSLDKTVIKMVEKTIPNLLKEHDYFTESMLLKEMDRKGRVKKADKETRLNRFMTRFIRDYQLQPMRVNKETRQTYQLPSKLKSNSTIYVKAAS